MDTESVPVVSTSGEVKDEQPVEVSAEVDTSSPLVQPNEVEDGGVELPAPERHSANIESQSRTSSRSQGSVEDANQQQQQGDTAVSGSGTIPASAGSNRPQEENSRNASSAPAGDQLNNEASKKVHYAKKAASPQPSSTMKNPEQPRVDDGGTYGFRGGQGTTSYNRERVYPVFQHNSNAVASTVLSNSLRTHPKGFRLLKQSSPLERRMNTYFRLPPQAPRRIQEEQERLQSQIYREIPSKTQSAAAVGKQVLLDGFMLLELSGVQDPLDAKEIIANDANISGSVAEDLSYFTNITFLDMGENSLHLGDLVGLEGLTEVHLHCCNVDTFKLPEERDDCFPNLHTLNVSFNRIRSSDLLQLRQLSALERLDLSSNNLKTLPADMSFLPNVTMLALENNQLSSEDVILSLSTMPSLVEVNLNRNRLSTIPRLSIRDGTGMCFPCIEVIGLGSNNLTYFEDLYSLTQIPSLKRVVLWGNPIQNRQKDCEILLFEFGSLDIHVLFELPIPPKRRIADFYAANASNFVAVSSKDLKPLPTVRLNRQFATGTAGPTAPPAANQQQPPTGPSGPSFFVTQPGEIPGAGGTQETGAGLDVSNGQSGSRGGLGAEEASDPSWFSGEQAPPAESAHRPRQRPPVGSTGFGGEATSGGRGAGHTPRSDDMAQRDDDGRVDFNVEDFGDDDQIDFSGGGFGTSSTKPKGKKGSRQRQDASGGGNGDVCRPNQTMRAAMTELRRMLRQPLPPISVTQYEQTTQSLAQRSVRHR